VLTTSSQLKQETLENIEKNIYHNTWYQRTHVGIGSYVRKIRKMKKLNLLVTKWIQTTALNVFPRDLESRSPKHPASLIWTWRTPCCQLGNRCQGEPGFRGEVEAATWGSQDRLVWPRLYRDGRAAIREIGLPVHFHGGWSCAVKRIIDTAWCLTGFIQCSRVVAEESDFNRFQARLKTYCNIILWSIHNMDTNINNDGVLQKSSVYTKGQN